MIEKQLKALLGKIVTVRLLYAGGVETRVVGFLRHKYPNQLNLGKWKVLQLNLNIRFYTDDVTYIEDNTITIDL